MHVLFGPHEHVPFIAHVPSQTLLLPRQLTSQVPPRQPKVQFAPALQVHGLLPPHLPVQRLLASHSAVQPVPRHSMLQLQLAGQVQVPPFMHCVLQQFCIEQVAASQVLRHPPPAPVMPPVPLAVPPVPPAAAVAPPAPVAFALEASVTSPPVPVAADEIVSAPPAPLVAAELKMPVPSRPRMQLATPRTARKAAARRQAKPIAPITAWYHARFVSKGYLMTAPAPSSSGTETRRKTSPAAVVAEAASSMPCDTRPLPKLFGARLHSTATRLPASASGG